MNVCITRVLKLRKNNFKAASVNFTKTCYIAYYKSVNLICSCIATHPDLKPRSHPAEALRTQAVEPALGAIVELAFSPSLPRPPNPTPTYHPSSTDGQLATGRLERGCSDMRPRKWSSRSRLLGPVSIRVTPQGTRPMHRQLLLGYEGVWASPRGLTGKLYFWTLL